MCCLWRQGGKDIAFGTVGRLLGHNQPDPPTRTVVKVRADFLKDLVCLAAPGAAEEKVQHSLVPFCNESGVPRHGSLLVVQAKIAQEHVAATPCVGTMREGLLIHAGKSVLIQVSYA